jgi:hypothetical protein
MAATLRHRSAAVLAVAALVLAACGSDDDASVAFASPSDGDTVGSPVPVEMEAEGVTVEPSDAGVNEGAGHFHVLIDAECVAEGEVIPNDDDHRHFGDGATSTELELEPGEHRLCLQFADGAHVATALTDEITVSVE